MVDKVLKKSDGLTFDVFNDKPEEEGKEPSTDPEHILIKEVVREPRMHFFKVPRLGSYLAVRLEYDSCLSIDAYDAGVKDAISVKERIQEQEDQKKAHDDQEAARMQECKDNEMSYTRDDGNWPEINLKPFQSSKVQFVVCLNTMG